MENNEKVRPEISDAANDDEIENVAGGQSINHLVCCTCGALIELNGSMMGYYYHNNICPFCKGPIKTW